MIAKRKAQVIGGGERPINIEQIAKGIAEKTISDMTLVIKQESKKWSIIFR